MCLAIFKPEKVAINKEHLRQGWICNSDGAGFAFIHKRKVVIKKGFLKLQDFLDSFDTVYKTHKTSPMLIHFRIRSMGARDADNTHPHAIPNGALIHNGTLSGTGARYNDGHSDTHLFVQKFRDSLSYDVVNKYKAEFDMAFDLNKLAMLYDNGNHVIINEGLGVWNEEVWYSNRTFEPRPLGAPSCGFDDWLGGGMHDD